MARGKIGIERGKAFGRRGGGVQGVWVFDEASGAVSFRPLTLVGFERNEALVAEGLKPGERVVTAGAALLRAGQKVKLLVEPPAAG